MTAPASGTPVPVPVIVPHAILNRVAQWVGNDRDKLRRASSWLNAGDPPMTIVMRLNQQGDITDDELAEIRAHWEHSGGMHRICGCFREALEQAVQNPYKQISAWLVTDIVRVPDAVHFESGDVIFVFVLAGDLGEGIRSKLLRNADASFTEALHALHAHVGNLLMPRASY